MEVEESAPPQLTPSSGVEGIRALKWNQLLPCSLQLRKSSEVEKTDPVQPSPASEVELAPRLQLPPSSEVEATPTLQLHPSSEVGHDDLFSAIPKL